MIYRSLHGEKLNKEQIDRLCNKGWILERAFHIYKNKTNVVAALELNVNGKPQRIVVKNFGWRNTISCVLSPVMRSRAKKSWDASHWLLDARIIVPRPISVYTDRKFGFIKKNFLLSEYISNYRSARRILRDVTVDTELKERVIKIIAEIISSLHSANLLHNDLTLGNFLVGDIDYNEVYLIDLNRLARKWWLTPKMKMYDISKMNLCRCNLEQEHENCTWLLFLRNYDPDNYDNNIVVLKKAIAKNRLRKQVKSLRKKKR